MLSDQQLLQFSRQIMLPTIDINGQQQLLDAHVLIIGLGGLGSPVAMYLAAAGIGNLTLVDDDKVDLSNLQRQIIHARDNIEQAKVESAKQRLAQINPDCNIQTIDRRLNESELESVVATVTLVVDCCDNFATRFLLNQICYQQKTPLVSGAAIRWEGQLTTFTMQPQTPCYRCLYEADVFSDQSCAHNGVVAPLVGIIGSSQAMECIKLITGAGELLVGRLLLFDGLTMEWRGIRFKPRKDCPVCGATH
ncbi:HesA/MoeB/ThiF family protein [Aliikangiella maris]|uniref:Molybdopterin-synthase adenylyltransferase MoeB n=2 Tax=Aliikangiella maris TaxID=3162458 RepID=A0ABV3MN06_9GAMM